LNCLRDEPPEPLFADAFDRREDPAYRNTVRKAVDQARASLFPPESGRFGRIRKSRSWSRAPSVFFATLQQLRHRGLRIAGHPGADTLQESVVPNLPTCDGLYIGVVRRFRDAS
jgi:hypothetical protein